MRLPFFYGWVIVVVTFVTMAIGVNARTAFSLFFPPIIDEFGWERGITAGAFSFGFVVSAAVSPLIGRMMDRFGPRGVMELGVALMAAGLLLAPLTTQPWHLYLTIGVHGRRRQRLSRLFRPIAVSAELVHSPPRPRHGARLRRRRHRLGHLAAVGAADDRADRLAHRLHRDGHHGPGRAGADQPVAAQAARGYRPAAGRRRRADRDIGRSRSPTSSIPSGPAPTGRCGARCAPRASGGSALGYFCGLYIWYAVQVHQTKYPARHRLQPNCRGLGAGRGQPARHSRPDLARASLRPGRARMDLGDELPGLCDLLRGADRAEILSDPAAGLSDDFRAGRARLWPDLDHGRGGAGDLSGQAVWQHFRHHHAGGAGGRRRGPLGDRLAARPHRQLHHRLCDRHCRQRAVGDRDLAGVAAAR